MAEASVALPPTRRVAATTANAVRERATRPAFKIVDTNIDLFLNSIATFVTSGTPVPVSSVGRFVAQCGVNWAVNPVRLRLTYLVMGQL